MGLRIRGAKGNKNVVKGSCDFCCETKELFTFMFMGVEANGCNECLLSGNIKGTTVCDN